MAGAAGGLATASALSRIALVEGSSGRGLGTDLRNGTVDTVPVASSLCSGSAGDVTSGGVLSRVAVVGAAIDEGACNNPTITVTTAVSIFMSKPARKQSADDYSQLSTLRESE